MTSKTKNYVEILKKPIVKFGNSGHIIVDKKFLGEEAEVRIRRTYLICRRCNETFTNSKLFSEDSRYCKDCFEAIQFLKKNKSKLKCMSCNKKITKEDYKHALDMEVCQECWLKNK